VLLDNKNYVIKFKVVNKKEGKVLKELKEEKYYKKYLKE